MNTNEKKAVERLVRHMQELQRKVKTPTNDDATREEVLKLFELLWEWTPYPRCMMPSKHAIEQLVALMRGCEHGYCYISRGDVARIIREEAKRNDIGRPLHVKLSTYDDTMSDNDFYDNGKWNYKATPLVDMLIDIHHKALIL